MSFLRARKRCWSMWSAQQFNWNYHLPGPDGQFGRRDISLVSNSNPLGLDPNDPAGKDDIVTTGELHVPVNRPVIVELSSKDVIHDFALPSMRIAQRRNSRFTHSDVVHADQDRDVRN